MATVVLVEFLTDEQAEAYGAFTQVPTRPELERFFFLDDNDRDLIALRRTDAHRLGMAVQICTLRYNGRFLGDDPLAVRGRVSRPGLHQAAGRCNSRRAAPHPVGGRTRPDTDWSPLRDLTANTETLRNWIRAGRASQPGGGRTRRRAPEDLRASGATENQATSATGVGVRVEVRSRVPADIPRTLFAPRPEPARFRGQWGRESFSPGEGYPVTVRAGSVPRGRAFLG